MLSTLDMTLIRVALREWGVALVYTDTQDDLLARFADVFATKPIQAIKEFRAVTGLGLKESKDIWDRIRPVALAAQERRDAGPAQSSLLKENTITDFEDIVRDLRTGKDDFWTERSIERVREFLKNC